ncbi:MAG: response regulator [Spirochaetia bacterium]|nr:response regulator [Spirochaetia bacterium]
MTVLIADDSSLIRTHLSKLIGRTREDITIKGSLDVESTIGELDSAAVDVLILDIQFPDGSGLDVLEHVRKTGAQPFVMVLTNLLSKRIKEKSLDLGADLFFDKTEEYERVVEEIVRLNHK